MYKLWYIVPDKYREAGPNMKQSEIEVGKVYTNIVTENRRVLALEAADDGTVMVRYQPMPWTMSPDKFLKHFDQLAPIPTKAQMLKLERIAPGVLCTTTTIAKFAAWAKQERDPNASKHNLPGRTMASQVIEAVMRKMYTSLSAERAFTYNCSTRENYITFGPCSLHWIYTMPDGSRIGFMAPVIMAELDDLGAPILTSHHQLDWKQSWSFGDAAKIKAAEQKLWLQANAPTAV